MIELKLALIEKIAITNPKKNPLKLSVMKEILGFFFLHYQSLFWTNQQQKRLQTQY